MNKTSRQILSAILYPTVIVVAFIVLWNILAYSAGSEFIFPPLLKTIKAFFRLLISADFYASLGGTLLRTLIAFIISIVLAIAFSLLGALYSPVRKLLAPAVSFFRALPTVAVTLIVAIWLGSRFAPIMVSLMVIMPTAYSAFSEGIDAIDRDILDMAKIDGANNAKLAFKFLLPLSLQFSKKSISATLSLNVKLMVASETLSGTAQSIGYSMMISSLYFETARLMALTTITVLVSILLEKLLFIILNRVYR